MTPRCHDHAQRAGRKFQSNGSRAHRAAHGRSPAWRKEAAGQLVAIFYPELRRLARSRMRREQPPHTWQPTVLARPSSRSFSRAGSKHHQRVRPGGHRNSPIRLSDIDPQLRTIVEMRVFEGFSIAEIASELNCAPRTVDRRGSRVTSLSTKFLTRVA
ncbi:MAG: hypothetical protein JOY54_15150 [Acidobacteriaceae bacterium]|nr:hypothetical protein [Acidobacteriaceae bacterium]